MESFTQFLDGFKGEDQYNAVAQVFEIMPHDSIIVCADCSDLDYRFSNVLGDLFVPTGSYEVFTNIGMFTVESNNVGPNGTKIFRVYWPSCEGGNASPVYLLTESYAKG